jgi:hypothetical protein
VELVAPGVKHFQDSAFCIAADLGAAADHTAICVLQQIKHSHVTVKGKTIKQWEEYQVRHMERLPLGVDYVQQMEYLQQLHQRPPLNGACPVILDHTGVGAGVSSIAIKLGIKPLIRVTITAGDGRSIKADGRVNVAKSVLISNLDAALHQKILKIAPALLEAKALEEELRDLRRHVSAAGRFQFEARVGRHDDLVLSLAMALDHFVGRKKLQPAVVTRARLT